MTHPKLLSIHLLALGAVLAWASPVALAQETVEELISESDEPSAQDRARIVAAYLIEGLPCTAADTSTALERRLTESLDPLVDLAAGLDVVAASEETCAEIRAAAARQRLYIIENALSGRATRATPASGSTLNLAFEVGPPPRNMLRQRSGSR